MSTLIINLQNLILIQKSRARNKNGLFYHSISKEEQKIKKTN